jgi:hypothetical protein
MAETMSGAIWAGQASVFSVRTVFEVSLAMT